MTDLCEDCPPVGYPTDKTRCAPCPRRQDVIRAVREIGKCLERAAAGEGIQLAAARGKIADLNDYLSDLSRRSAPETPAPPEDVQMERLANYVGAYESLKTKSPKELVDLVLEHVIDLKPFHELLIEELCSRVHPGWEKDDSQVKTGAEP